MPTTIAELGPLFDRFIVAPEALDTKDDAILRHWTDSILNNVTKNNVIATANNSGIEFMLQQELSAITPSTAKATIGGARELQLQDLLKTGLTSASVSAFTALLESFDMYNDSLLGTSKHHSNDAKAHAIEAVLESFSSTIFNSYRIYKNEAVMADMLASRNRDLLIIVVEAAVTTLGNVEAKDLREKMQGNQEAAGSALQAGGRTDPRKSGRYEKKKPEKKKERAPYQPPTAWVSTMRDCANCADHPIEGGKHLDKNCPKLKGGNGGSGLMVRGGDDALAEQIFGGDTPVDVSLGTLLDPNATSADVALSRLAHGAANLSRGTLSGTSTSISDRGDIASVTSELSIGSAVLDSRNFYVLNDASSSVAGVLYGDWKGEVLPWLREHHYSGENSSSIKSLCSAFTSLENAASRCTLLELEPIFHGPVFDARTAMMQPGDRIGGTLPPPKSDSEPEIEDEYESDTTSAPELTEDDDGVKTARQDSLETVTSNQPSASDAKIALLEAQAIAHKEKILRMEAEARWKDDPPSLPSALRNVRAPPRWIGWSTGEMLLMMLLTATAATAAFAYSKFSFDAGETETALAWLPTVLPTACIVATATMAALTTNLHWWQGKLARSRAEVIAFIGGSLGLGPRTRSPDLKPVQSNFYEGSPTWLLVAYAIRWFFATVPLLWLRLSCSHLCTETRHFVLSSSVRIARQVGRTWQRYCHAERRLARHAAHVSIAVAILTCKCVVLPAIRIHSVLFGRRNRRLRAAAPSYVRSLQASAVNVAILFTVASTCLTTMSALAHSPGSVVPDPSLEIYVSRPPGSCLTGRVLRTLLRGTADSSTWLVTELMSHHGARLSSTIWAMSQWDNGSVVPVVSNPKDDDYRCHPSTPRALQLYKSKSSGRALIARHGRRVAWQIPTVSARLSIIIHAIIDSGCSWHVHHRREDLINLRPSHETMTGVDGKPRRVEAIGDLPVVAKDRRGRSRKLIIPNVRLVSSFSDTLLSVDQFFSDGLVETHFNGKNVLILPADGDSPRLELPFERRDKLFYWDVTTLAGMAADGTTARTMDSMHDARAMKATMHAPKTASHVAALPPDTMLEVMHRRLHLGHDLLRRLGEVAADVPANISRGFASSCEHCKEANATHVPHTGAAYQPTHAGRLIHADIAGPFTRSIHGQYQYFLVLVDDHSRYKQVYFLRNKSEAPACIRKFVAKFNALLNRRRTTPIKVLGTLHSDNAGEFLSKQFGELLDESSITQTRCPAHVHQLNGVAERAIRSILENVRANLVASGCKTSFWPYMVEHAVDCLNRTTGPPKSKTSSYEVLTGEKPKVMTILPYGCRAYAVKPRSAFTKTNFDPRAWVGINLGRAQHTPGAYNVWVPPLSKVVCTSEVFFDEGHFPWRPRGDQRLGDPMPTAPPPPADSDSAPPAPPAPSSGGGSTAATAASTTSMAQAYDMATRSALNYAEPATARQSRRILILFSGPYNRPDGLAAHLNKLGFETTMLDNDPDSGGGQAGDILNDDVNNTLLRRTAAGEFFAVFAAPPCSTFSITRHFQARGSADGGPPVVRSRKLIKGIQNVPNGHRRELEVANAIVARMAAIVMTSYRVGSQYCIENPADRGDSNHPRRFLDNEHGPLWLMPEMITLRRDYGGRIATFPMCAFSAPWQKYTSLLYSPGMDEWLGPLDRLTCRHTSHARAAGGGVGSEGIASSETSAYPANFNHYLSLAFASLHRHGPPLEITTPRSGGEADGAETPLPSQTLAQLLPSLPTNSGPPEPAPAPVIAATESTSAPQPLETGGVDDIDAEESPTHSPPRGKARAKPEPFQRGLPMATRSRRPQLDSGVQDSSGWRGAGFIGLLGATTISAAKGVAGFAGLAKPATGDPKSQAEAYASDEKGWRASEEKELNNHRSNGS
ncbi:MAG: hypothetical protein ACKVI4_15900, partial [Actinomycetales bacterium]